MTLIEIGVYSLNEAILTSELFAADVGGSMTIHVFGAYFGLACAMTAARKDHHHGHKENTGVYHSNIFSLIGKCWWRNACTDFVQTI